MDNVAVFSQWKRNRILADPVIDRFLGESIPKEYEIFKEQLISFLIDSIDVIWVPKSISNQQLEDYCRAIKQVHDNDITIDGNTSPD
jgi:hypothetical protein